MNSTELMDKGITCLIEKMGVIEAERFISIIIREKSDYNCFFDVSEQDIEEGITIASDFIRAIEQYILNRPIISEE